MHHGLEILALVVRGQADDEAHARIIAAVPEKLPTNTELAERFEPRDMLELDGADAFDLPPTDARRAHPRVGRPRGAARVDGEATRLSGIGGTIEGKIVEVVETGDMNALAKLRAKLPPARRRHARSRARSQNSAEALDGAGSRRPRRPARRAEQQKLRDLSGLGAKTEEKVLKSLAAPPKAAAATGRTLLGQAPAVRRAVEEIEASGLADRVSEAGSVRRRAETTKDIDLIATATDPAALTSFFSEREWVAEVVAKGGTKATVVSHEGFRFDLRVVPPESYGNLLQHFTGSKDHNVALREDAVRQGSPSASTGSPTPRVATPSRRRTRNRSTPASATPGSRPSCARTEASSRPPAKVRCRTWSSSPT